MPRARGDVQIRTTARDSHGATMSTHLSAFFLIQQLNRLIAKRLDATLAHEDMTARYFLILDLLAEHEPCSSAELARKAHITAQSMGETVKVLERRGLLVRSGADSGRTIYLERTEAGRALFMRCRERVRQAETEMLSCLRFGDAAQLRGSLALVRELEIARNHGEE